MFILTYEVLTNRGFHYIAQISVEFIPFADIVIKWTLANYCAKYECCK